MQQLLNFKNPQEIKYFEPFIGKAYKGIYYIYFVSIKTGKRTKKTTKTRNQRDANRKLEQFKRIYYNNIEDQNIKRLADLLRILVEFRKAKFRKKTLELYNTSLRSLISIIGDKELKYIMFLDIEKYMSRQAERIEKSSINIYVRTLKAAFNYAKKVGAIYENPVNAVDLYKLPQKQRLSFEIEDIPRMIDSIEKPYLKRIVKIALESSSRISEILNLQWKDVNIRDGLIYIRNKDDFETKTGEERYIPLSDNIWDIVSENPYLNDNETPVQQDLFKEGPNIYELCQGKTNDYIFGKSDGSKYSSGFISKLFKKDIIKAGFDTNFCFHCLRHTSITNMGNSNFPLFYMQKIAGHKNIKTTEGYVHVSLKDIRNYMNSVNYSGIR